jgi:hypothetical protein
MPLILVCSSSPRQKIGLIPSITQQPSFDELAMHKHIPQKHAVNNATFSNSSMLIAGLSTPPTTQDADLQADAAPRPPTITSFANKASESAATVRPDYTPSDLWPILAVSLIVIQGFAIAWFLTQQAALRATHVYLAPKAAVRYVSNAN